MADDRKTKNQAESIVREFHEEVPEMEMCLGAECPHKNCRICPAAGKGHGKVFDDGAGNRTQGEATWDSYRASVKRGYYSSSIIEVVDPETGKKRYIYSRPGS